MFVVVAEFFRTGGPLMWGILAALAAAVAIIAERWHFFSVVCRRDADDLAAGAVRRLEDGDASTALASLVDRRCPAAIVLAQAIRGHVHGLPFAAVRGGAEETAVRHVPAYSRRIGYLAMLANIATLSGLLGTIFGLQRSFGSLARAEAAEKALVLAAGIGQAMNTTAFGLIVAILCLVAYARLSSMAARKTEQCDAAAIKLLNYLEVRDAGERREPVAVVERAAV